MDCTVPTVHKVLRLNGTRRFDRPIWGNNVEFSRPLPTHVVVSQLRHTVGPNSKNPSKTRFINFVKLTGYTYSCNRQIINMKRMQWPETKTCKYVDISLNYVLQVKLFPASFSHMEPLCAITAADLLPFHCASLRRDVAACRPKWREICESCNFKPFKAGFGLLRSRKKSLQHSNQRPRI